MTVGVSIDQPVRVLAANHHAGVVTWVAQPGILASGDAIYAVDTMPVVVAPGDLPFYRAMASGDRGDDVAQLQRMLADGGYLDAAPEGMFGPATHAAVQRWQRDHGREASGVVVLGDVVAVPQLPGFVSVAEDIATGAVVQGGEPAVSGPAGPLLFASSLSEQQSTQIPSDAAIAVEFEGRQWPAVIASMTPDERGVLVMTLESPDGGPVCASDCAELQSGARVLATGRVEVTKQTDGPSVPLAAVRTASDGSTYVTMRSGARQAVAVRGASGGIAVVDGVDVGDEVIILEPSGAIDPSSTPLDAATPQPTNATAS